MVSLLCYLSTLVSRNACSNFAKRSEYNFMNLMILANFSQIRQSKISSANLMILMNLSHFCYCMHFWPYLYPSGSTATQHCEKTLCVVFIDTI